jgi:UTP--glucose-1-phosphate uridylyltransferase
LRVRKAVFPACRLGHPLPPRDQGAAQGDAAAGRQADHPVRGRGSRRGGIEQVIIVTSSQKRAIEDHFDHSYELEHLLEEKGDIEMLRVVRAISDLAQVAYVRQKEQLGLGHAVLMAKDLIGHEPFAVILPDDVVVAERPCIGQLIHAYHQTHSSVVAVMEVPPEETGATGSSPRSRPRTRSTTAGSTGHALVEKPAPARRPRTWRHRPLRADPEDLRQARADAARRRRRDPADRRDRALMEEQEVYAYEFEGTRYDAGTTMGWLKASVEIALHRPDLGTEFRAYLQDLQL